MKWLFLVAVIGLSGCVLDEKNNASNCDDGNLPFHGCWVTQECLQLSSASGQLIEKWAKAQYRLDDDSITMQVYGYDDASCSGAALPSSMSPDVAYVLKEKQTTGDGLESFLITVSMPAREGQTPFAVDGALVVTAEQQLCSTQQLYFGATTFAAAEGLAKNTGLYENCLIRGVLP